MPELEIWKKLLIIAGSITQVIGYFTNSNILIIIGLISIITGTIAILLVK